MRFKLMYSPTKDLYQLYDTQNSVGSRVYSLKVLLKIIKDKKRCLDFTREIKLYDGLVVFEFNNIRELKNYFIEYLI